MKPLLRTSFLLGVALSVYLPAKAQLKLGDNPTAIRTDAILELNSANQGLLLPRVLKAQITGSGNLFAAPDGMMVYVKDVGEMAVYVKQNGVWVKSGSNITVNGQSGPTIVLKTDDISEGTVNLYYTDARARAAITVATPGLSFTAGGLLTNTGVTSFKTRTGAVIPANGDYNLNMMGDANITSPSSGQVLQYQAGKWVNWTPDLSVFNVWSTTGNSTNVAANYLGTTNLNSINFRTNNVERGRILTDGRWSIGGPDSNYASNVGAALMLKNRMIIESNGPGTNNEIIFTKASTGGVNRIADDNGDFQMQGGNNIPFAFGASQSIIFFGDRNNTSYVPTSATTGTGVFIPSQRTVSVPLGIQAIASQTANLTEWRSSAGTAISAVDKSGNLGLGTAAPAQTLHVAGTMRLTGNVATTSTGLLGRDATGDITGVTIGSTSAPAATTPFSFATNVLNINNTAALWNANKILSVTVPAISTTDGMVLKSSGTGTALVWATDNGLSALADGKIWIGVGPGAAPTPATVSGDVTMTNAGVVTIANGAVTAAKMAQNGAASGQTLNWNGTTWIPQTPIASIGLAMPSIFAVSASPLTANGTITTTLNTQTANTVFAGPSSGAAATPTFRALTAADLPSNLATYIQNQNAAAQATSNFWISGAGKTGGTMEVGGTAGATSGLKFTGLTSATTPATGNNNLLTLDASGNVIYAANPAMNLADGKVWVGVGTTPTPVSVSGDATMDNTGLLTIGTKKITTAKINDQAVGLTQLANGTANAFLSTSAAGVPFWNTATFQAANLADGKVWVGVGTTPTPVSVSGDATMNNTGALTIAANAVTAAKIANATITTTQLANATASSVLTTSAAGVPAWAPASGFLTSVGVAMPSIFTVTNSPLTANGTITTALNTQTANTIFAGPASGANGVPAFRAITAADLPSNLATYIQNQSAAAQATSNFWISGAGKTGSTMEVGGTAGAVSGLKFTGLTSATTPTTGNNNLLTLNAAGNVIYATNPAASLADDKIWVGVGAGATPTPVTMSGDATMDNTGLLTIGTKKITTAKINDQAVGLTQLANGTANAFLSTSAAGVPFWNTTAYQPASLADGKMWIGVGTTPTAATLSGDATITNAGVLNISTGAIVTADLAANAVTAAKIANATITTTQLANATAASILTTSATGVPTWVPSSGFLSSVGVTMPSIFTVTNSPLTANGTIATTLNTQAANTIFAGPSTGAASAPTFRALTATDIPANMTAYIQNQNAAAQASGNFWISGSGKTGGTMEVGGAVGSTSGLKFTGMTSATTPVAGNNNVLTLDPSGNVIYAVNPAANNWLITGNTGVAATSFLGTTDDKIMTLKSNSQPFLSFGRRATLGLTQTYTDYTNDDEKVTYVQSALQFQADGADFYKPKMWTDADGNFRMKGSAAGTDYFEFGSAGTSNAGSFEFIVGDDGDEPIVFKNYNFNTGIIAENMRIQSGKVGIGMAGATPNRKLDVEGDMRLTGNAGTVATKLLGKDNNGDVDSVMISTATTALTMTNNVLAASNTTALWNANQLQGKAVSATAPTSGQILQYNGTNWVPVSAGAASTIVSSVTITSANPGTVALGSSNFVRLVSGGGFNSTFTISKFSAGTYDGQQVTIYNSVAGNMSLTNLGGGAGQINTMGSTSNTNGIGMAIVTWSAADNTWLLTSLVQ